MVICCAMNVYWCWIDERNWWIGGVTYAGILDSLSPVHLDGYKLSYIAQIGVRLIGDEN